jgi:hypothetical protein
MQEAKRLNVLGRLTVAGAIVAALAAGALSFGVSSSMDEAGGRRLNGNPHVEQQVANEHAKVLAGGARRGTNK